MYFRHSCAFFSACGVRGRPLWRSSAAVIMARMSDSVVMVTPYPRPAIRGKVNKARWVLTDGAFFPFTLTDADIAEAELQLTKDDGTWYPARVAA